MTKRVVAVRFLARLSRLTLALTLAACSGLDPNGQGLTQPQATTGPCTVQRFFIVRYSTTPTAMAIENTGQPCHFIVFNPDLQIVLDGVLLSERPKHGRVEAGFANGRNSAFVSYVPEPGYAGPDRFDVTIQPGAQDVTVNVTVAKGGGGKAGG